MNFVKLALENGGAIKPLIIPAEHTNGTGLCNPSVFVDDGKILVNVRHTQYHLSMYIQVWFGKFCPSYIQPSF